MCTPSPIPARRGPLHRPNPLSPSKKKPPDVTREASRSRSMATIWYDKDADISRLKGRTVAIIGYGSQGHAHALNLRDSGVNVVVGLHATSKSAAKAKADGLTVLSADEAARRADIVMILTPDTGQKKLYDSSIAPHLKAGKTLMFAHGFNIRFGPVSYTHLTLP